MDFTVKKYELLLNALIDSKYEFQTFTDFIKNPKKKSVILRHDVDLRPLYSLRFAEIQATKNVKGVYYFRSVPQSWDEKIIRKIHHLGHEIGYHYECLTSEKGNFTNAIKKFEQDLDNLRKIAPVHTICMHGSPMSKYDSKDLWKHYNYRDFDLLAEPYFDINFNNVLYLTDTGRTWKNKKISVRDRVESELQFEFTHSDEIISAIRQDQLPDQIMFNFHPQRWTNNYGSWTKELIIQNMKNQIKRFVIKN
jgi:hypothetical protein